MADFLCIRHLRHGARIYERHNLQLLKPTVAEPLDKLNLSIQLNSQRVTTTLELKSFPRADFDNLYALWETGHKLPSLSRNHEIS